MKRKREIFKKYIFIISFLNFLMRFIPKFFTKILFRVFKYSESRLGFLIRYLCLKKISNICGINVGIFHNVNLLNLENLSIGDNVSIHPMCYIDCKGGITIGNDVSIAHGVSILSTEHNYSDLSLNIKDQGCIEKSVILENNIWIGAGAKILAGTYIEEGSIIAAGAIVKGRVNKNSIYGGVLAKKIKERM